MKLFQHSGNCHLNKVLKTSAYPSISLVVLLLATIFILPSLAFAATEELITVILLIPGFIIAISLLVIVFTYLAEIFIFFKKSMVAWKEHYMFGFDKQRLENKMIQGVEKVRLVLYKVLYTEFIEKYDEDEDELKDFADAIVNEIFGSHDETSQSIFDELEEILTKDIVNLGKEHPELKRPITDAIRKLMTAKFMLNGRIPENQETIIKNAMERGIFIEGGDNPKPDTFLEMSEALVRKYI